MNQITKSPPIGRNIERIRKLRGIKQEDLALQLGITRQAVSKIEQSETIDEEKLDQIAQILGVSADGIKNFTEAGTINYVQNNYEGSIKESSNIFANTHCSFNPFDKVMELVDENRKLYEQLIQSEREKVAILQNKLGGK